MAKGQRTGVLDAGPGGLGGGGSLLQRVLDGPKGSIGGTGAPLPGRPHRVLDLVKMRIDRIRQQGHACNH
ncbi:hypothetical protein XFLM_10460 [Xylella fastidiosa subsp. fastidiosa GB514]|nr:hypothetical protein XFLM_10460 [Xylella fastidiosa subsp. fastidiosa GB514]